MLSQETTAKTTASTNSRKKVSRQSSPCRFSNCSKRAEMFGRASVPDPVSVAPERGGGDGVRWSFKGIRGKETRPQAQSAVNIGSIAYLYCRNDEFASATAEPGRVPQAYLYCSLTKEERRPEYPGRR